MSTQYSTTVYSGVLLLLLPLEMSEYPPISRSEATPVVDASASELNLTIDAPAPSAKDAKLNYSATQLRTM